MRGEHRSNIKQRTCRICSVVSLSLIKGIVFVKLVMFIVLTCYYKI